MGRKWKVRVKSSGAPEHVRWRRLLSGVTTALVAIAITAAYFGVIALLMIPAFDLT